MEANLESTESTESSATEQEPQAEVLESNAVTQTEPVVEPIVETTAAEEPVPAAPAASAVVTRIHPFDFAVLLEAAATKNPDLEVERTPDDTFILNGVSYEQTVEVPPSAEGQAHFDTQVAEYREQQRLRKRNSLPGLREELDALIARVTDLEARIEDHNSRSGHKI
jgi:hypothetical protein